jgi:hypothetical protein
MHQNDYQNLFLRNETYMKAINRSSVSVMSLGFREFHVLPENEEKLWSNKKGLRAIIPTTDQVEYMDRIDTALEILRSPKMRQLAAQLQPGYVGKKKSKTPPGIGKGVDAVDIQFNSTDPGKLKEINLLSKESNQKQRPKSANTASANLLDPKRPVAYFRPTQRQLAEIEEAKQLVEERERQEKWKQKWANKRDFIAPDGTRYVYDFRGYKIKEEEYLKWKERKELEKRHKLEKAETQRTLETMISLKFSTNSALLEKTSKYVEGIRSMTHLVSFPFSCRLTSIHS